MRVLDRLARPGVRLIGDQVACDQHDGRDHADQRAGDRGEVRQRQLPAQTTTPRQCHGQRPFGWRQTVAHAPDGLDRVAEIAEFLAQTQDRVVDGAVALDCRLAPHRVVQVGAAERAALVAEQQVEQPKLGARELERLAVQPGQVSGRVDDQWTEVQRRGAFGAVGREDLLQALMAPQ